MKMTIDEVIKEMELEFNTFLSETGMCTSDAIKHEQATNVDFDKVYTANKTAIDIMRKYQKIEEIVDEWKHDHDNLNYADDSYYWSKVREVIEDGKID